LGIAAIPAARVLAACGGSDGNTVDGATGTDSPGADAAGDATSSGWATGGTASMTDQASYPNPFAGGVPTTCALMCEMTQGPCWDSAAETIQDISYGQDGLPVRYYFQLVDDECNPVSGATIDIWHVAPTGKYSGNDSANEDVSFCTGNDSAYTSTLWFRGKQTTDANGLAYFDGCFPGWYSGRTIHVHFIVTVNGQSTLTSQLVFPDTLDDAIVATQPIYKSRGSRDTTNATDTAVPSSADADYSFAWQQMTDGAMLAWKTLTVRASSTEQTCSLGEM
jgi:protocatechuate 3,4-dioxygenase beta subunit